MGKTRKRRGKRQYGEDQGVGDSFARASRKDRLMRNRKRRLQRQGG